MVEGLTSHTTPRGIRAIRLHWSADPDRDLAWKAEQRLPYASDKDWRRENELDWTSAEGDVFYPEFAEVGRERYIAKATGLIQAPVIRSFDFGYRRPACTWFQYAPGSDRVFVLREFMPHELGTHDFRDAVQFLSGRIDYASLPDRSKAWVDFYAERSKDAPQPPWFTPTDDFIDIGGPEANRTEASAMRATEESCANMVFANGGINLTLVDPPVRGRTDLIRRLLRLRKDGWPGIVLDPQCIELLQMFDGALSFKIPTKLDPITVAPKSDGHFENLHDALGYGIVAVVPLEDKPVAVDPGQFYGWDGRKFLHQHDQAHITWYDTDRQRSRRSRRRM